MIAGIGVTLLAATLAVPAATSPPRPLTLTGGQHSCSYTRTEYLLTDENMLVHARPGTTWFSATHVPGRRSWEDAYWVTGFHDEAASICNSRNVPGGSRAIPMPVPFTPYTRIEASMHAHGQGRLGFDIWLTASRTETTARAMQSDPRTFEILITPFGPRTVRYQRPGWHRIFIGRIPECSASFSFRGLDVAALLRHLGVPRGMWLMAVDAGGESTYGSFTVDSYSLAVWHSPVPMYWLAGHHRS